MSSLKSSVELSPNVDSDAEEINENQLSDVLSEVENFEETSELTFHGT